MTLHAAKGLEFPVVYMLANEQGILPHERSLAKDEDLEEERRLAFVGLTRAKEELYLSYARLREFRGQTLYAVPSMFLEELPPEGVENVDLSASGAGSTAPRNTGAAMPVPGARNGTTPAFPCPRRLEAQETKRRPARLQRSSVILKECWSITTITAAAESRK